MLRTLKDFEGLLGNPSYKDDDVLLYTGDSVDLLKRLPKASIPLTITSPPYNIGKSYESILPIGEYLDWVEKWSTLIHTATAKTGAFWLNVGYMPVPQQAKAMPIPYLLWNRVPFFLIQEIVWNYGAGVAGRLFFSPRNEKLLWYVKDAENYVFNLDDIRDPDVKYPNQKKNGKLKCNTNGKNPSDVWQIPKVTSGKDRSSNERTPHPAQFPLALVNRVILASSHEGDVVLDPFVGSGSSLEAAVRLKRKAIGFELNPDYVKLATDRIKKMRRNIADESAQHTLL